MKFKEFDSRQHWVETEEPNSSDLAIGGEIAHTLGDTFIDTNIMSPTEQWERIVMGLRLHGLEIKEAVYPIFHIYAINK